SAKLDGFMGAVSGAAQQALKQVAAELAATGRVLTPLDPVAARDGDFVVTSDCALHVITKTGGDRPRLLQLRAVHPAKGAVSVWREDMNPPLACAFGVRKA
ncbi:MAG: hypothetical protein ACRDZ4_08320, partial [Egibacteraceae bacterium]